jgi:hypothetical protein
MRIALLLVPAPNRPLLSKLANSYERTGEGEPELTLVFERTVLNAEVLVDYAVLLGGRPSLS